MQNALLLTASYSIYYLEGLLSVLSISESEPQGKIKPFRTLPILLPPYYLEVIHGVPNAASRQHIIPRQVIQHSARKDTNICQIDSFVDCALIAVGLTHVRSCAVLV